MPLEEYKRKRSFEKTPEPEGSIAHPSEQLHYAVQKHAARRLHYDLRLEWNGVLLSWAVPKGPSMNPKDKRLAVQVEDHPLEYRKFEGNIPKGEYGGGTVQLFDEGFWEPLMEVEAALKKGELKFNLIGQRFKGRFVLVRLKPKAGEEEKNWLLIKEKDEFILNESGTDKVETSIGSGRTMQEIRQEGQTSSEDGTGYAERWLNANRSTLFDDLPFQEASPMLAKAQSKPPTKGNWRHEIKFDGYRLIAFLENDSVRLLTRSGLDWTDHFPEIADALQDWDKPANLVLDGEVVVFDENGRSDFQLLQNPARGGKPSGVSYVVFDLLAVGSVDIRKHKLEERQSLLSEVLMDKPLILIPSPRVEGDASQLFGQLCDRDLEGVVSKRLGSVYSSSQNGDWVKTKCVFRQEFVVVGYTRSAKKRAGLSSLLLGVYDGEKLLYAGRTGTGFTDKQSVDLVKRFEPFKQGKMTVTIPVEYRAPEEITWLKPQLVAEVKFAEITDSGVVRQASFKGLREDKDAKEVVMESKQTPIGEDEEVKSEKPIRKTIKAKRSKSLSIAGVDISSPDKIYDPSTGITKGQVAQYYETISEKMLPHLENRLVSLVRAPEGITGESFYMKHIPDQNQGIPEVEIKEKSGEKAGYITIPDQTSLLSAVQLSTIEFHTWGSSLPKLEQPDQLVFDLDPAEGLDLDSVRKGVRDLRSILDELGMRSILKTSGGKGYHLVLPLTAQARWKKGRDFAKNIASLMQARWPKLYTANMRKDLRKGKIYIDWVRNGRGATSVCVFSLRARPGLSISWPIEWQDLDKIAPDQVTILNFEDYPVPAEWNKFKDIDQKLVDA